MRKFSPFQNSPKPQIQRVGNNETGYIYLLKKNGLSPNENAVDMQQASKKQAKVSALILTAVSNYAEKHGLTEEEARKAFFESGADINPANYLDPVSKEQYMLLLTDVSEIPYKAATLMIRYRLLYNVEVAQRVKAGSTNLKVTPVSFTLMAGDKLRFDNQVVVVESVLDDENLVVKPLAANLDSGAVGFLIDFESGKEKVGYPAWDLESTRDLLIEAQISALHDFYKSETGELKADEPSDDNLLEGNLPVESNDSVNTPVAV